MKKNKLFIIIIFILAVIILILGIKTYTLNETAKNNESIYCVMEDKTQQTKMEMYFDFKDNQVYRYTVISTNPYTENINITNYETALNNTNKKFEGATSKVWTDNKKVVTTEISNLDLLSETEFKELTGMSKKELQSKNRDEIIESIIPFTSEENTIFECK
ncbi:MAG: hypothetical protein E7168_05495 [Firmicutes bacterium]|nr:hypothetical protein [Bacillota bacterium]